MLSTERIMEKLTGHHMVDTFVQWMVQEHEDFAEAYQQYLSAMRTLRREIGASANDEMDAIEQQCASNLIFSCLLGLKANLDNFKEPLASSFLDVDAEVYLREKTVHRLPKYEEAQKARNQFRAQLTSEQKEIYDHVVSYTCYLETAGPKLVHYFGYMLGNQLFPWIIPGYHEDSNLTKRYTDMLNSYFGKPVFSSIM